MSKEKKLLKCKDFPAQLTPGLIAIIDGNPVVIQTIAIMDDYVRVFYRYIVSFGKWDDHSKDFAHDALINTYIVVDEL